MKLGFGNREVNVIVEDVNLRFMTGSKCFGPRGISQIRWEEIKYLKTFLIENWRKKNTPRKSIQNTPEIRDGNQMDGQRSTKIELTD